MSRVDPSSLSDASQTLSSGAGVVFTDGAVNGVVNDTLDVRTVEWAANPFAWASSSSEAATTVVTIEVGSNNVLELAACRSCLSITQ